VKIIIFILSLAELLTGLRAAQLWHRSSLVFPIPTWATGGGIEPGDTTLAQMSELAGVVEAGTKTSALNAVAARWTAIAVVIGSTATIAGILFG
jgi:hypothetical protein